LIKGTKDQGAVKGWLGCRMKPRESGYGIHSSAFVREGGSRDEKFLATTAVRGRASTWVCLNGGNVRKRVKGNRIQTCRSELDSDQTNKVKGTGW
jgi:hypothetical protein